MSEFKNDWYFVKCTEKEIRKNVRYYVCLYSNGFDERIFLREFGKDIPSILSKEKVDAKDNESLISSIKNSK